MSNLVLLMDFNSGPDNYEEDHSGYGNHGTVSNPARVVSPTCMGLDFDGVDDYVDCGTGSVLSPSPSFTGRAIGYIDYSLTTSDMDNWARWIDCKDGWHIRYMPDLKQISCVVRLTTAGNKFLTYTISASGWYDVVLVFNGTDGILYVNGVERDSFSVASDTVNYTETTVYLGGDQTNNNFKGIIDEVRIYNRTLSETEVKALFNEIRHEYGL